MKILIVALLVVAAPLIVDCLKCYFGRKEKFDRRDVIECPPDQQMCFYAITEDKEDGTKEHYRHCYTPSQFDALCKGFAESDKVIKCDNCKEDLCNAN